MQKLTQHITLSHHATAIHGLNGQIPLQAQQCRWLCALNDKLLFPDMCYAFTIHVVKAYQSRMLIFPVLHRPLAEITLLYCAQNRQITLFRIGDEIKKVANVHNYLHEWWVIGIFT